MVELKGYQEAAVMTFDGWWKALLESRAESMKRLEKYKTANLAPPALTQNYPYQAWEAITRNGGASKSTYVDRTDKAGRHIPHVCIKIPTGGGKTLVASAVLERLSLKSGLVLWVVPTRRIYEQTKDSLRRRDSPIRQRLDRGGGGRVKFMEKDDALNKNDAEQHLCVMPLMLAAVNRSKNKDFLLMHRDSGRYRSFFPDVDDDARTKELRERYSELECHKNGTVVRSLANVLRMLRPIIVLDEAHKAYGRRRQEYAEMINQLSPKLVVELSATPNPTISNLLVDVSGKDLWSEEMIKMPINLYVRTDQDWQNVLHMVYDKREQLEGDAKLLQSKTGRYIRPIALVRVERTGKNQRDGRFIHAEDVKDYLIKRCAVPPTHIAVQSSSQRDLESIDLLSEATEIRWIITKDAIKEGWDCPFAYVLAILDNIKTHTSVTQLLGRVLRQPEAQRTKVDKLDMCYVYCQSGDTGKVVKYVKKGLAEEGMADVGPMVLPGGAGKTAMRIKKRQRPGGRIFLPMVLHKDGDSWTNLQYDRHILSNVDFAAVRAPDPASFDPTLHGWYKFLIGPDGISAPPSPLEAHGYKAVMVSDFARPLSDVVPNIWQAARIAQDFIERLVQLGNTRDDIYNALHYLVKILRDDVSRSINRQAEVVFRDKLKPWVYTF